mmetsp:Transcript_8319/g.11008  ORF Transcript_8319/g.11008 Transcript_8319/m.11008 type:complete len:205 (-) Transcript_8319:359-973(-)
MTRPLISYLRISRRGQGMCLLMFPYWLIISIFLNVLYAISGKWNIAGVFIIPIGVGILFISCSQCLSRCIYWCCGIDVFNSYDVSDNTEVIPVEKYAHELETFKICRDIEGQEIEIPAPFTITSTHSCCICLNDFQKVEEIARFRLCKHYFHLNCITEWIKNKPSCPLCNNQLKASEDGHTPPGENVDITEEENKQQTISENNF